MKKLLMFATAMTIAASTSFAITEVFDYKASVKHAYLKVVTARDSSGVNQKVLSKYVKSASLKGYFILPCDGTPRATDNAGEAGKYGFLVLINNSAEKAVRDPKIMPAKIDVDVWENFKNKSAKTTPVEGYFYAGGPFENSSVASTHLLFPLYTLLDYYYQSRFLFGLYNDFSLAYFHDAWMNHAGFGRATTSTTGGGCAVVSSHYSLDTLSGVVKGGLYLCLKHGNLTTGSIFDSRPQGWEFYHIYDPYDAAWEDGYIRLQTTDVISGTWSLKRNTRITPLALTTEEKAVLADIEVNRYIKRATDNLKRDYPAADPNESNWTQGVLPNGVVGDTFAATYGINNPNP
ncbi:MAG TPA: hypothetical protein PK576_04150 [Kiritimatiellia bacterium]|nr:hypothetical protein [Kiritimatiellia bacterium]